MNNKLQIKNNNFSKEKIVIKKYNDQRLTFNFSFLTDDKKFNLKKQEKKVKVKLVEKIENLSQESKTAILGRKKEDGLEKIHSNEIHGLRINKFFKKTRCCDCDEDFWIFRLSNLGRVIGKMNNNIFYILAIDTNFQLYNHGKGHH